MAKKYFLNEGTGILHKENCGCPHYRQPNSNSQEGRYFDTIDEVIVYAQRYFHYCRKCFKEK